MILHRLTPGQLALAVAVAALFALLLYLLRERRRTVRVPYLPLIEEALARRLPTGLGPWLQRLKSWAIQVAVIAAALLALADAEESGSLEIRHEPRVPRPPHELVLVLDRSRTMGARRAELEWCGEGADRSGLCALRPGGGGDVPTTLDRARARAAEVLARLPGDARVLVASLDGAVHLHALWVPPEQALEALDEVRPSDLGDDPSALASWVSALRRAHPRAEVRAVTDLHREEPWATLGVMGVAVDGVGSPRANLRVSALGVRADAERPGRVEIHCRVSFTAPAGHLDPAHVLLEIGAANARDAARPIPLATREIVMGPGEEAGVEIVLDDVPGSLLRARAIPSAPSDDALETDSLRWAEVPALRPARVSLSGTAGPALLAALAADPYIELLSPSYSSGASARTQEIPVRVVLGSLPTKIDAATLILAPPVDPERALAGIAELPAGVLKRERHTIWGELDPGSVVVDGGTALLPSATERSFLSTGGAVVGTVGTLDSFPLVRLGLDPEDPSLSESPLLPALLAGVVDHLAGRSDEIGVEHPAGAVDLRGAADPAIELLRLDSSAPPEEVAGRALHVERAGPYLLRRRSGASEVLIVVPPRDESESPASAHTELEPISVVAAERSPRRASLWWWLVLGLCCTCLLEHLLFVRRRLL